MLGPLRKFRLMIVRLTLMVVGIGAIVAYSLVDSASAIGVLLGGLGSTLAFWLMASRLEKLATIPADKLQLAVYRWTFFRMIIYGMVFYRAYTLDTVGYHGLIGAIVGFLIHRAVLIFVAATGLDLKQKD